LCAHDWQGVAESTGTVFCLHALRIISLVGGREAEWDGTASRSSVHVRYCRLALTAALVDADLPCDASLGRWRKS
jgi:hypothetical protein